MSFLYFAFALIFLGMLEGGIKFFALIAGVVVVGYIGKKLIDRFV